MRKTSTPASHKRRIMCVSCEAGPKVATIFTLRRRRMLSLSLGGRSGLVSTDDEYGTRANVCTGCYNTQAMLHDKSRGQSFRNCRILQLYIIGQTIFVRRIRFPLNERL